jgi:branched-subunit amino acid aminotransferase/4-amino-4-deoxychorismate lyase
MTDSFANSLALRWDPSLHQFEIRELSKIAWQATNLGCMHGAFLVERMRTFAGKVLDTKPHLDRLERGCNLLGIPIQPFLRKFQAGLGVLLEESRDLLESQGDASMCIVVSPGDYFSGAGCHAIVHWIPMPWETLSQWYQHGTSLVRVQYASGAGECWPSDIKARSRLNYFLSDREAKRRCENGLALLCTSRGMVADTSVANLLVVTHNGKLLSPRREDIVQGTSLAYVESLLGAEGKSIEYRDIHFEELYEATEVLLVGNSGCVWSASALGKRPIGLGPNGPMCLLLQEQWQRACGCEWKSQAIRMAEFTLERKNSPDKQH